MRLNKEQEKAVQTVEGRLLILAGAGSGKTRVIVHRIAHLLQLGVSPSAILGLTFTNKAAAEMRQRVVGLVGSTAAGQLTLSTFHSFCMQILRKEIHRLGYTRDFSLYDERDMRRFANKMLQEPPGEGPEDKKEEEESVSCSKEDFNARLQPALRAYNAVNFDGLITLAIQLFEEHPSILEKYQDRYRYLMIDEYQDTNPAQFRLAELLSQKYGNLCVVGDDDQSIYGWRGADVKNILDFKADTVIKLEQNYRSTTTILAAANAVIDKNQKRYKKKLWCEEGSAPPIEVFHAPTDAEEAQAVVERILEARASKGLKWREMAILYRSNALSRQLEIALLARRIPYEVFGGLEFSERSEIKDLLAYLRLIANPLDDEAMLRIINVPRRGISDAFLDTATQYNRSNNIPLWKALQQIAIGSYEIGTSRARGAVQAFLDLIGRFRNIFQTKPLSESLIQFVEEIQYKRAIEEEVKSEQMRLLKWENVQECINALAQYELETEQEEISLQHFISTTMLARMPRRDIERKQQDQVQLMTLHSAKGLEFPVCFIVGLEDHILPHEKSLLETGVEEERRLFYVGITRAQRYLTLSMARSRLKMGKMIATTPSRFLFEIPKALLKATSHKL